MLQKFLYRRPCKEDVRLQSASTARQVDDRRNCYCWFWFFVPTDCVFETTPKQEPLSFTDPFDNKLAGNGTKLVLKFVLAQKEAHEDTIVNAKSNGSVVYTDMLSVYRQS